MIHVITPVMPLVELFIVGMFGLDGARHTIKIGQLSGGQKARVCFASISLQRAHIMVLDEPTVCSTVLQNVKGI